MINPGVQLVCVMWALAALSLVLVGLRLYTRVRVVRFVGADDYMYAATGVLLLAFAAALQVAVGHGLGQAFASLSLARSSDAIFWTYVANSCAIAGNAMAKLSLGLFLLRVVQLRWHRAALWLVVAVTAATSAALVVVLWNQTTPARASWDPLRTPGVWHVRIQPLSVGLGAWSSVCDFVLAAFPWLFIWSLRMPRRDKAVLASSMSLGVIAGICGIIRTVVLSRLQVLNYTVTFVTYFAWAGAEIAVAMIGLGIPTLRPLYLRSRGRAAAAHTDPRPSRGARPAASHSVRLDDTLPPFTMCVPAPAAATTRGGDLLAEKHAAADDLEAAAGAASSAPSTASTASSSRDRSGTDEDGHALGGGLTAPPPARPVARPARVHARHGHDSVEEILGFYGQSHGLAASRSHEPILGRGRRGPRPNGGTR